MQVSDALNPPIWRGLRCLLAPSQSAAIMGEYAASIVGKRARLASLERVSNNAVLRLVSESFVLVQVGPARCGG